MLQHNDGPDWTLARTSPKRFLSCVCGMEGCQCQSPADFILVGRVIITPCTLSTKVKCNCHTADISETTSMRSCFTFSNADVWASSVDLLCWRCSRSNRGRELNSSERKITHSLPLAPVGNHGLVHCRVVCCLVHSCNNLICVGFSLAVHWRCIKLIKRGRYIGTTREKGVAKFMWFLSQRLCFAHLLGTATASSEIRKGGRQHSVDADDIGSNKGTLVRTKNLVPQAEQSKPRAR